MLKVQQTADFLRKNPFGQIPLLECDDFTISESRAIARVLAVRYDDIEPSLVPDYRRNAEAYALFEEAIAMESMKFDPYASSLIYHKLIAPYVVLTVGIYNCAPFAETFKVRLVDPQMSPLSQRTKKG